MSVVSVRKVEDYMTKEPVVVHPGADVHEAITLLAKQQVCAVPVVDEMNTLVGILSERDCLEAFLRAEYYESPNALVEELMCTEVVSVTPTTDVFKAAELFAKKRFHHLPVLYGDRLVGQISRKDIIRAIGEMRHWG